MVKFLAIKHDIYSTTPNFYKYIYAAYPITCRDKACLVSQIRKKGNTSIMGRIPFSLCLLIGHRRQGMPCLYSSSNHFFPDLVFNQIRIPAPMMTPIVNTTPNMFIIQPSAYPHRTSPLFFSLRCLSSPIHKHSNNRYQRASSQ